MAALGIQPVSGTILRADFAQAHGDQAGQHHSAARPN